MIKFRPPNPVNLVNPVGLEMRPLCMIGENWALDIIPLSEKSEMK